MELPYAEPYKIKMVETIKRSTVAQRKTMDQRCQLQSIQPVL